MLKSQAIWLSEGDNNTKFFNKYAAFRKNFNTIWELEGADGSKVSSFKDIASAGKNHFHYLFKESAASNIDEIVKVISLFPRFFDEEVNAGMEAVVSKEELKVLLSSFKKRKSPNLNNWTIEVYLGFYDLLEEDLLRVIEESKLPKKNLGAMNATFIALIPKKINLSTFENFRPISLCNLVYKIVSKIIANRLKQALSNMVTEE
jgi:hypothetical protein